MTSNSDLKQLIRARMALTGENYTTARAALAADRAEAERFRDRTLRSFLREGRLVSIPVKRRARVVILLHLLQNFEIGRDYPEKQVNEILSVWHPDVAYLRRELVDYGFMRRADGVYRVAEEFPDHGHIAAGDMPADARAQFRKAIG